MLAVPFLAADVRHVDPPGTASWRPGSRPALSSAVGDFPLAHRFSRLLDHVITTTCQRRQPADTWTWWSYQTLTAPATRRASVVGAAVRACPCDCVAAATSAAGGAAAAVANPAAAGANAAAAVSSLDSGDDASHRDSQWESKQSAGALPVATNAPACPPVYHAAHLLR